MGVRQWSESLLQDLRYGLRQLRRSPGFTLVAVLSLGLGIGANTAIFQLVDAVRLRSLPVQKPQELAYVDFAEKSSRAGWWSSRSARLTYGVFDQIRTQQQAFDGFFSWSATRFNLSTGGEARYAEGLWVSGGFFRTLGVKPMIGRTLTTEDDRPGCSPNAVLSYAFWQREFGGDPGVVGRTINLDSHAVPIVGVTSPTFFGVEVGRQFDAAIPVCADPLFGEPERSRITMKDAWWLSGMGRLKPGWTVERAAAHLRTLSPGIMQATVPPKYRPDMAKRYLANKLDVTPANTGVSNLRRAYETPLWLLLAITGLVLLIACANLANLLLARASVREREVAVRQAIGASRSRLVRQLLAESLLLAVLGAGFGAVLAQVLSRALVAFITTADNPLFVGLGVDWRVLSFTAALAVTTCLLFGLVPAWRATRIAPGTAMKAGGRGTTAGRERFGLRRALVVTQVALSLVCLVGALLFVRSLHNLLTAEAGFQPEGILVANLDLRQPKYDKTRLPAIYREIGERIASRPGISGVAQAAITPISGSGWDGTLVPIGQPPMAGDRESWFNRVSPGYFAAMGTPILAGRDFDQRDTATSPMVAIVNQEFARKFFGGQNPVGRSYREEVGPGETEHVVQIVGLVRNTKYQQLREDTRPIVYLAMSQEDKPGANAQYVIRAKASMADVMSGVKSAVAEVHPAIGIQFRVMSIQIENSLLRDRLMATLSGAFGLLAALLATLGLYGVMTYMVARRRSEIGVRIALGANRGNVLKLILGEAGLLVAAGLVAGTLLALWAGRTAATLLYGLKPQDPVTLALAPALLAAVALAASYIPARRAAGVDPAVALREE